MNSQNNNLLIDQEVYKRRAQSQAAPRQGIRAIHLKQQMGHKSKINQQTPLKDSLLVNQNFHIFDIQDNKAQDIYSRNLLQSSLINSSRELIHFPDNKSIQSHRSSKEKLQVGSLLPIKYYKFQDQHQYRVQLFSKDALSQTMQKSPKNEKIEKNQKQEDKFQSCYLKNIMPQNNQTIYYKRMRNCKAVRGNNPIKPDQGFKELKKGSDTQVPIQLFDSSNSQSPQKMHNIIDQQSFRENLYHQLGFSQYSTENIQGTFIKNNQNNEKQINEIPDQKSYNQQQSQALYQKQLQSTSSVISTTDKSQRAKSAHITWRKQKLNNEDSGDQLFHNLLVINQKNNQYFDNYSQNTQLYQNQPFFQDKFNQQYIQINQQNYSNHTYQQVQQPTQLSPFQHILKQKKNQIQQRIQNTKKLQQMRYSPHKYQLLANSDTQKQKVFISQNKQEQYQNNNDSYVSQEFKAKQDSNCSLHDQDDGKNNKNENNLQIDQSQEDIKIDLNQVENNFNTSEDEVEGQESDEEAISPLNVLNQRHLLTPKSIKKSNQIQLFKQNQENILIHLEDIRKQQDQQLELIEQSQTERMHLNAKKNNQVLNFNSFLNQNETKEINKDNYSLQNHYAVQEQNLNEQINCLQENHNNKTFRKNSLLNLIHNEINKTAPLRNKGDDNNQKYDFNGGIFRSNYYEFIEQCDLKNQFNNIENSQTKNEEIDNNSQKILTIHSNGNNDYCHNLTRKYDTQLERQISKQQKVNYKGKRINISHQNSVEKLDQRIYFPSTANHPSRPKNQSDISQFEHVQNVNKNNRIIHSSYDKSRNDYLSQKISYEVEKNVANINSKINKTNPFLASKAKEKIPGLISELKQKEFEMENIQGFHSERKDRVYSARLRSAHNKQLSSDNKSKQQQKESNKNQESPNKKKQSSYNQILQNTNNSPSQRFVWNKLVESKPSEINIDLWNMITQFLSVSDLSFTRLVSKAWNRYAINQIKERHKHQLLIDTQKSEDIKKKYDIQIIYKVLNSKTQDIYQLFGPLCSLSIQQLQQPLFLSFQPPCLQIALECFRLFLSQNKLYSFRNRLFKQKQKKTNYPNLIGESLGLQSLINQIEKQGSKINNNLNGNYLNNKVNNNNSGKLKTNLSSNAILLCEETQKMQVMRKRYYSKLFLGENMNKTSILHDAINQKKDLLWFICTFDFNYIHKIQKLLNNNQKIMYSKQITQYGDVVFKITDLLLGIVSLYKKLQQHYPHIIQYVDSIRYYYTIHYKIGDKINKQI